jgi:outer membrane immunogenic protein
MKKTIFTSIALAAMASTAIAADLPSRKAPVEPMAAPLWTGFYAGVNIGYNFGTNGSVDSQAYNPQWLFPNQAFPGQPVTVSPPGTINSSNVAFLSYSGLAGNNQNGVIGGGQIGYNYQYGSNIVLGFETDFQGTATSGTSKIQGSSYGLQPYQGPANTVANNSVAPFTSGSVAGAATTALGNSIIQTGVNWLGTVRGRLGYLFTPTLLVYGTGGLAYGGAYAKVSQTSVENVDHQRCMSNTSISCYPGSAPSIQNLWLGSGNQSQTLVGWSAGGGGEWMFMPNWSLKGEAIYWDLGRMNVNTSAYGSGINIPSAAGFLGNSNYGWGRTSVQYSGIIARAGINYHFNFGSAPVAAKY